MLSDFQKSIDFFLRFPDFAFFPFGKSNVKMKISMEHWCNDTDRRKQKYWEKPCTFATSSTTDVTWTDLEKIPCLPGEMPPTNRLSHDTALWKNVTRIYSVVCQQAECTATLLTYCGDSNPHFQS